MSGSSGDASLADLRASVDGSPTAAVALAVLAGGASTVLVAVAYGFVFEPPVNAGNVFPPAAAFDDATAYRQFYRYDVLFEAFDRVPLFLSGFAVVAAGGVATSRRAVPGAQVRRLAVAAGLAAGIGYGLLATVGVWTLPPGSTTDPLPAVARSNGLAAATNALALAAVTAAGTVAATAAVALTLPQRRDTEEGA